MLCDSYASKNGEFVNQVPANTRGDLVLGIFAATQRGHVLLTKKDVSGARYRDVRSLSYPSLEQIQHELSLPDRSWHITVNTFNGSRKTSHLKTVNAAMADLDGGLPEEWPVEPTEIIETSHGKFQALWRFEEACQPWLAKRVLDKLVHVLSADPGAASLTQSYRLPGGTNFKGGQRHLVRRVGGSGEPVSYWDLAKALGVDLTPPEWERSQPALSANEALQFIGDLSWYLNKFARPNITVKSDAEWKSGGDLKKHWLKAVFGCLDLADSVTREERKIVKEALLSFSRGDGLTASVRRIFQVYCDELGNERFVQNYESPERYWETTGLEPITAASVRAAWRKIRSAARNLSKSVSIAGARKVVPEVKAWCREQAEAHVYATTKSSAKRAFQLAVTEWLEDDPALNEDALLAICSKVGCKKETAIKWLRDLELAGLIIKTKLSAGGSLKIAFSEDLISKCPICPQGVLLYDEDHGDAQADEPSEPHVEALSFPVGSLNPAIDADRLEALIADLRDGTADLRSLDAARVFEGPVTWFFDCALRALERYERRVERYRETGMRKRVKVEIIGSGDTSRKVFAEKRVTLRVCPAEQLRQELQAMADTDIGAFVAEVQEGFRRSAFSKAKNPVLALAHGLASVNAEMGRVTLGTVKAAKERAHWCKVRTARLVEEGKFNAAVLFEQMARLERYHSAATMETWGD